MELELGLEPGNAAVRLVGLLELVLPGVHVSDALIEDEAVADKLALEVTGEPNEPAEPGSVVGGLDIGALEPEPEDEDLGSNPLYGVD